MNKVSPKVLALLATLTLVWGTNWPLFAIVGVIVAPIVFEVFKTNYRFIDVVAASVLAAAATLVPTFGGSLSLLVMIVVLYWRVRADLFPDIVLAVAASRLAMLPVLLLAKVNPPPFF